MDELGDALKELEDREAVNRPKKTEESPEPKDLDDKKSDGLSSGRKNGEASAVSLGGIDKLQFGTADSHANLIPERPSSVKGSIVGSPGPREPASPGAGDPALLTSDAFNKASVSPKATKADEGADLRGEGEAN